VFSSNTNRFKDGGLFTNGIMGEKYLINIFVHIINSNMRDIHTERSDNFCCLHFLYSKYLQNWRLPRFSMIGR
jgi:hypothetical protein